MRVERLLDGLIASTQIPGRALPLGQLRRGFGGHDHLARERERLRIAHDGVVLRLNLPCQVDDDVGDFQCDSLSSRLAHFLARG